MGRYLTNVPTASLVIVSINRYLSKEEAGRCNLLIEIMSYGLYLMELLEAFNIAISDSFFLRLS